MKACILVLALAVATQAQKFAPAKCDWEKEMVCPGMWDYKNGEQGPDICVPRKTGDCWNTCPEDCGILQMNCPGGIYPDGCKAPDMCVPLEQSKFLIIYDLSPSLIIENSFAREKNHLRRML